MDQSIVYTKTARGVLELKNGAKDLTGSLAAVLRRIDGRSSLGNLCAGMEGRELQAFRDAVASLESQSFVKVFARGPAPIEIHGDENDAELSGIVTMQVEELGPEESVRAWAEARRGARELVQSGYYTTPHADTNTRANAHAKRNLMIVEDDEAISRLMKFYLSRFDFNVTVISDGQEALTALEEHITPDIVLLDVNLPNINGFDILAYIRSRDTLRHLPAVMVTAQVSDADVLRGLKGGADGYIFKPFEWSALHGCIDKVLNVSS